MSDEVKGAQETSPTPTALEAAIASSPEVVEATPQVQETETPTPIQGTQEQVVEQEEGRIPYSRFKEKVDETNWYKQQVEQLIQQRQSQLNVQQPLQDPYANMTAEEKVFWQGIDKRIESRASEIAETKIRQISPVIDAGRMELAQIKVQQFRAQHPDIKANSPEEMEIAQRINQGYTPDDAYWATMGPRGKQEVVQQVKQQVKLQNVAKKMANVETSTSVNIPTKPIEAPRSIPRTAEERYLHQKASIKRFRDDLMAKFDKEQKP